MRKEVTKSQLSKFLEVDSDSDFDGQVTFNSGGANNNAALELTPSECRMVIDDVSPIQSKEKKVRNKDQEELQVLNERTAVLQDFFTKRGVMRQPAI